MGSCEVKRGGSPTLFHPFCAACRDVMRLSPMRTRIKACRMVFVPWSVHEQGCLAYS